MKTGDIVLMRSIYYKELKKIYILSYLSGRKECYCDGIFFAIPLYEYFTYMRLGRNNKYA